MRGTAPTRDVSVIWHEAECGGYAADLELWRELADAANGPILELGCGGGRVTSHLARRGHPVRGLDHDARLIVDLAGAELGDAQSFDLGAEFELILAPMQLVQLLAGAQEREHCLRCVAAHLALGGIAAFAIVEAMPEPVDAAPPLPDTREVDGWIYSSLPIETVADGRTIQIRRLRQVVSPAGEMSEEVDDVALQALDATTLETEAQTAGLRPAGRHAVPATDDHVGSTIVLLQKES